MARAVLRKIITDAQTGQANLIRNLPELLLPPVLQLPDCRDLESNTERRSAQFLGKPEQMPANLTLHFADAIFHRLLMRIPIDWLMIELPRLPHIIK